MSADPGLNSQIPNSYFLSPSVRTHQLRLPENMAGHGPFELRRIAASRETDDVIQGVQLEKITVGSRRRRRSTITGSAPAVAPAHRCLRFAPFGNDRGFRRDVPQHPVDPSPVRGVRVVHNQCQALGALRNPRYVQLRIDVCAVGRESGGYRSGVSEGGRRDTEFIHRPLLVPGTSLRLVAETRVNAKRHSRAPDDQRDTIRLHRRSIAAARDRRQPFERGGMTTTPVVTAAPVELTPSRGGDNLARCSMTTLDVRRKTYQG